MNWKFLKHPATLTTFFIIFSSLFVVVSYFLYKRCYSIEWHMINVNYGRIQGDANLIIDKNKFIMIDAGAYNEAEKKVVPYLKERGINKIQHFFISHPHFDHYEGMEALQNHGIKIKNVYYSLPPESIKDCCYNKHEFLKYINAAKDRGAIIHEIGEGFKLELSGTNYLEVLYAHKTANYKNKQVSVNDLSLVMMWNVQNKKVLFTGDLNLTIGSFLAKDERMKADI